MTKPLYLGMSILDISKIPMSEIWYDYIIPKHGDKVNYVIQILIVLLFILKLKIF